MTPAELAGLALAALCAAALVIPVAGITEQELGHARDLTLLGLLVCAVGVLVWAGEAWLACMAASFAVHWRSHKQLPALVCWIGIAGAWLLATRLATVVR